MTEASGTPVRVNDVKANPRRYVSRRGTGPRHRQLGDPTPEREAKMPYGVVDRVVVPRAGPVEPTVSTRARSVIEANERHYTTVEKTAVDRFLEDLALAERLYRVSDPEAGPGGGSNGARASHVPYYQGELVHKLNWIWEGLDLRMRTVVETVFMERRCARIGSPFSLTDLGRAISAYRDKASQRKVGLGASKPVIWQLEWLYTAYHDAPLRRALAGYRRRLELRREIDSRPYARRIRCLTQSS